jgi:uncharacterized protein (TIGR00369 family)
MAARRGRVGRAEGADPMSAPGDPLAADIERAVRDSFARQGLLGTIGAWFVSAGSGRVVVELPYSARISASPGQFHPAVIGALGDAAGMHAALTRMPAGSCAESMEYKVNFVRPAAGLLLRAEGSVISAAGPVVTTRTDVWISGGGFAGICAVLQATVMRAEGQASGKSEK